MSTMPNERAGGDGGTALQLDFGHHWPAALHHGRYAASVRHQS